MVAARVPLTTIAKIVGWSDSTTIAMATRYSHPEESEMRAAVESISGFPEGLHHFSRQSPTDFRPVVTKLLILLVGPSGRFSNFSGLENLLGFQIIG